MIWVAIIIIVVVIVLLLWWWLSRRPAAPAATYSPPRLQEKTEPLAPAPKAAPVVMAAKVVEAPPPAPVTALEATMPEAVSEPPAAPLQPEDLTIVEGIGPKISGMLRAEGIVTLAQLAATDVQRLRDIMLAAKLRIADPTTWPQQAALAAAGKMDELKALQDTLKAGRRG
jgi:predicted flap endonuclease-1-like 5' DNA nuclease